MCAPTARNAASKRPHFIVSRIFDTFEFSDLKVIFPAEDTAVVAYKVHQRGELKGEPMDMQCADSTAWVKDGRAWKCALHTETILETA